MASKGKPKPKLRDLSNRKPTDEEWQKLQAALSDGPAMIVAVLGQSFVELELDETLRRHLKHCSDDGWNELTGDRGPLFTFSHKIMMGHALGLYDEYTRYYLNCIRSIRNAFAHSKIILDFDHPLVEDHLRRIPLPPKKYSFRYQSIKSIRSRKTNAQAAYRDLCGIVFVDLVGRRIRSANASIRNYRSSRKKRDELTINSGLFGLGQQALLANALLNHPPTQILNSTTGVSSTALPSQPGILGNLSHLLGKGEEPEQAE